VIFALEKRRSRSADIARIDRISRAILLRFRNRFCYVGSSHYSYPTFIPRICGYVQYLWYSSSKRSLSSLSLSYSKKALLGLVGGGFVVRFTEELVGGGFVENIDNVNKAGL
jgi:hypothetical protein